MYSKCRIELLWIEGTAPALRSTDPNSSSGSCYFVTAQVRSAKGPASSPPGATHSPPLKYFWSYPVFEAVRYDEIQRDTADTAGYS